jgi:hypothetical protein
MDLRAKILFRPSRSMQSAMKRVVKIASSVFLISCASGTALASGYIQMPEQTKVLPSYHACQSALQDTFRTDQAEAGPASRTNEGVTREVSFESATSGVKRLGRGHYIYIGRIWYAHSSLRTDIAMIQTAHSWQQTEMECKGRTLTSRPASGYTLSTFVPVLQTQPD